MEGRSPSEGGTREPAHSDYIFADLFVDMVNAILS